jgi:hypothetical protein
MGDDCRIGEFQQDGMGDLDGINGITKLTEGEGGILTGRHEGDEGQEKDGELGRN